MFDIVDNIKLQQRTRSYKVNDDLNLKEVKIRYTHKFSPR